MKKIPIIHVHGKLGPLPWEDKKGRAYFPTDNPPAIKFASEQIIVISERTAESKEFDEAFELMSSATKIFFIGFGYHPVNLQRLRVNEIPIEGKILKGTRYGIGDVDLMPILAQFRPNKISFSVKSATILDFFEDFALLE